MFRTRVLALAACVGAAAVSSAAWVKWADVDTGFVPGTGSSFGPSLLHFVYPYSDPGAFNDLGQYYLQLSAASDLTAYDYNGNGTSSPRVGTYRWLLDNYSLGTGTQAANSHLLGTGASNVGSTTVLDSTGVWDWYNPAFGQTQLANWGFTGRFRLIDEGVSGKISFQAETVPEPFTMALCGAGLGLALLRRKRKA